MTFEPNFAPLHRGLSGVLLLATVVAASLTCVPATGDSAPSAASDEETQEQMDNARTKETLSTMRDVGTSMFAWVTDVITEQERPAPIEGQNAEQEEEQEEQGTFDWSRCPAISHQELEKILVPVYMQELPATDGWGHPLELCLNRNPASSGKYLVGMKSPGRDGVFEGSTYRAGAFPFGEFDRDLVWIDGFFVAWPKRGAG